MKPLTLLKRLVILFLIVSGVTACGSGGGGGNGNGGGNGAEAQFKTFSYVDQGIGIEAFRMLLPSDWDFDGGIDWKFDIGNLKFG